LDRFHRSGIDPVVEARGETHGSEHAQLVFGEAAVGIADGAHDSGCEVVTPADEVEDLVGGGIEHHAIDGEVAPQDVLARIAGEAHFIGMTSVGVAYVRAESGDLDGGATSVVVRHGFGSGTSTTPNCSPTAKVCGRFASPGAEWRRWLRRSRQARG